MVPLLELPLERLLPELEPPEYEPLREVLEPPRVIPEERFSEEELREGV